MSKWKIISNNIEIHHNESRHIEEILNSDKEKEIVLCVGQVQSGKTRRIIEIIKKAINLNYNFVILFGGTNNLLLTQTEGRVKSELSNLSDVIIKSNGNYSGINDNTKTYVFNILKLNKNIDTMLDAWKTEDFKDKKVLIIDDECDYGSINNSKDDASEVYNSIKRLFERMYYCRLFQITATPYGNILNSKSNNLKAKKIICWGTNEGYTGWDFFDNRKEEIYIRKDTNRRYEEDLKDILFESIIEYIYASFSLYKSNIKEKTEMLINVSLFKDVHNSIKDMCITIFDKINNKKEEFYERYLKDRFLKDNMGFGDYIDFINYFFKKKEITVLNNDNEIDLKGSKIYMIYIGGVMISRGNTYENLIVELFLNSPNDLINVDTLLQRCRWFGYRKEERIKHMKIFMTHKIYDSLIECKEYIHLFKEGIYESSYLEYELQQIDKDRDFVRGTSNEKSR